ncbi:MAG: hypothetical protein ACK5KU_08870 [Beutenbergiaceae bacterium]
MRAFDPQHTPQSLRPAGVNIRVLFLLGTAGWLGALIIALLARSEFDLDPRLVPLCLVGTLLGVAGYLWARIRPSSEDN